MPTYEYKCEACGFEFEKFQSIKAAPVRKCPHCGKNRVKRLISTGAGLIFTGGGFYITDYRSEAYKSAAKADTNAASGSKESTAAAAKGAESASGGKDTPAKTGGDAKPAAAAKETPKSKPAAAEKSGKSEK
jgi:putative FmdB family regulatory protein